MGDYGDTMMRNQNAALQARTKTQNRANDLHLKMIGKSHPTGLTPNLLKLFEPRPPLEYKPSPDKRKCPPYTGMAQFVGKFAEPGDPQYAAPVLKGETPAERRARIHQMRLEEGAKKAAQDLEKYDTNSDPNISGNPYKTLFVARLNYETSESRVKREFEVYGPIKQVRLVTDQSNKPRGYAFIEYVHTRDMKAAYKQADGKKIDGKRVLVDVERGRTVPNWRPRRLGGGLGTSRVGNEEVIQKQVQREQVQSGGISRYEKPRVERDRDREKSRNRGKERERERKKPRDRDHRDDRHHRDRDRTRDCGRDRDRGWDHGRERDLPRERGNQDYETGAHDHNYYRGQSRGRSQDRDFEYDDERVDSRRERDYGEMAEHGQHDYYGKQGRGQYDYNRMGDDFEYGYERDGVPE
ncbi:U1 small nuclear ribonucleoprotein 70 kDa [Striga hermonthica]|uniref:U1 small nuclear ribonucleoprotein 70 kDa n=1 Tax=Striga hermonthica TaxID=68872 RepID=A0A9N7RNV9_STRHE|nr:U1 small nuclear ribonucleoprotein 70 kDa [Striga hermonthica]